MSQHSKAALKPFPGFQGPNYTQVPDQLFDELLPELSGSELKVLLYIIRRTFGFKRDADAISLSQMLNGIVKRDGTRLDHGAGLTKKPLLKALRSLEERGIILVERRTDGERGHRPSIYRLKVRGQRPLGGVSPPRVGADLPQGGGGETPPSPRGQMSPTQETDEQETGKQKTDSNLSSSRRAEPVDKSVPSAGADPSPASAVPAVESVGNVLAERLANGSLPEDDRPETMEEDYQVIQHYIKDRAREFNDAATLRVSTKRAWNLYQRSGLSLENFLSRIYQARGITQEMSASIKKTVDDERYGRQKSKMAYFFRVLEDKVGLRELPGKATREP